MLPKHNRKQYRKRHWLVVDCNRLRHCYTTDYIHITRVLLLRVVHLLRMLEMPCVLRLIVVHIVPEEMMIDRNRTEFHDIY
jgi:hypothetical protein